MNLKIIVLTLGIMFLIFFLCISIFNPKAISRVNFGKPTYSCTGPDLDCPDFSTHAEAQAFFESCGFSATNDPMRLDSQGVGDGIACVNLP